MEVVIAAISAVVGWVSGLATAFSGLWVYRHTVKRDAFQDHCSSYEKRIAMREKELEQAVEEPDKETKRHRLSELRDEYDQFLEAWQQKQELAKLVPPRAITADKPKPSAEEVAQLVELLAGSTRLPPAVLTAEDYFTRGNAYYKAGDYKQALEAYNGALELRPDHPVALSNRGNTLDELKRYEEALRDFNRALELRPDDPDTLNNRGNTFDNMGQHEDALKDYNRALELRPDHPTTLMNRGATLDIMGRYEDALKDYNRALELRPDHPDTLNNRGITLRKLERYEEALTDYNRALELKPDDPDTLNNRGYALTRMGRSEEALQDINRALELEPEAADLLESRAEAYSMEGEFEKALRDLEAAVNKDSNLREVARTDGYESFEALRKDAQYGPHFRKLVGEE